jgi:hypothetical protein
MNNQSILEKVEKAVELDQKTRFDYVEVESEPTQDDVALVRANRVNLLSPRRLMSEVDRDLKYFGYTYHSEVLREIKQSTGVKAVLGQILKRHMKQDEVNTPAPIFTGTTERFERINSAVAKMPIDAKNFIHRHYVINDDRKDHRNEEAIYRYAERIGVPLRTYQRELKLAKECFVVMQDII